MIWRSTEVNGRGDAGSRVLGWENAFFSGSSALLGYGSRSRHRVGQDRRAQGARLQRDGIDGLCRRRHVIGHEEALGLRRLRAGHQPVRLGWVASAMALLPVLPNVHADQHVVVVQASAVAGLKTPELSESYHSGT